MTGVGKPLVWVGVILGIGAMILTAQVIKAARAAPPAIVAVPCSSCTARHQHLNRDAALPQETQQ